MGRREHVKHLIAKVLAENPGLLPLETAEMISDRLRAEGLIIVSGKRWPGGVNTTGLNADGLPLTFPLSERLIVIGNRDGWICQICELPVDQILRIPDPMAPTIDHILPKSRYSNNDLSNLALAHRKCNNRKGDKLDYRLTHPDGVERIEAEA